MVLGTGKLKMNRRQLTEEETLWQQNLKRIWLSKKSELGLTQEKLAAKIGWKTQGAVTSYLNGRIPLNTDAKVKFSEALGVDTKEIDPNFLAEKKTTPTNSMEFMSMYGEVFENLTDAELLKVAGSIELLVQQHALNGKK